MIYEVVTFLRLKKKSISGKAKLYTKIRGYGWACQVLWVLVMTKVELMSLWRGWEDGERKVGGLILSSSKFSPASSFVTCVCSKSWHRSTLWLPWLWPLWIKIKWSWWPELKSFILSQAIFRSYIFQWGRERCRHDGDKQLVLITQRLNFFF